METNTFIKPRNWMKYHNVFKQLEIWLDELQKCFNNLFLRIVISNQQQPSCIWTVTCHYITIQLYPLYICRFITYVQQCWYGYITDMISINHLYRWWSLCLHLVVTDLLL